MSADHPAAPEPDDPAALDPLIEHWSPGDVLRRCHHVRFAPAEFNPSESSGRFRPVRTAGRAVATLYAADSAAGALSETALRDVTGPRAQLARARLSGLRLSTLTPGRSLRLVALHGLGLRRLGLARAQLIDTSSSGFALTARWAAALHDCPASPDGLIWRARTHDDSLAVMLFGSRVTADELHVIGAALALDSAPGLELVRALCIVSDVALVE